MAKKFDGDLIFLYSENARTRIREIAHMLTKSPQRLKYSLKMLEKEGFVNHPHCIFDYSYFGLILFRVYFKGGYISEKDKDYIIKELKENEYVVSIYELTGEFDLAVEMLSPNPSRFNKELKKVTSLIPTLNNYKIILNLVSFIYPREYLLKNNQLADIVSKDIIVGGDRSIEQFDSNEMEVVRNILENPRIRMTTLAKQTKLNVKTTTNILKTLKKRRIVKGFKFVVDTNKLDINKFRLFLKLHNLNIEREKQLKEYFLKTKEIVKVNKTVGDWDIEIDIESLDKSKIRYLIVQLREGFKDLIENFNIIEFYQYYQVSYLPRYLFKENISEETAPN